MQTIDDAVDDFFHIELGLFVAPTDDGLYGGIPEFGLGWEQRRSQRLQGRAGSFGKILGRGDGHER